MKIISSYGAPFGHSTFQKISSILQVILGELLKADSESELAEIVERGKRELDDVLKWIENVQDATKKQLAHELDTLKRIVNIQKSKLVGQTEISTSERFIRELVSQENRMKKLMDTFLHRKKVCEFCKTVRFS